MRRKIEKLAWVMLLGTALPARALAVPINVTTLSHLSFGEAPQGDPPRTVAAGSSESPTNASFQVTGNPNKTYTIVLPAGPVDLTTGAGGPGERIALSAFHSTPAEGANGLLDAQGAQTVYCGATRAALALNQATGSYQGSFSFTAVY